MATLTPGVLVEMAGTGKFVTGEYGMLVLPRRWKPGGRAAVYCGGYSQGAWNLRGWFGWLELANEGVAVLATDLGDTPSAPGGSATTGNGGPGTWGNDTTQTALTTLYTWTQTKLGATSRIALIGGSQGAAPAVRWAAANPDKVSAVALGIGAVDTEDIRANNRNGYAASVQTAFGLSAGQSVPTGKTGVGVAASLTVPVLDYYSDDDPICVPATHTAFAAANPTQIDSRSFGAQGHTLTGFPWGTVTDWLLARA